MTELEKCELAKSKGFTYDPLTGNVRGMRGRVITTKYRDNYIIAIIYADKQYKIRAHRLAWYLHYGKLPENQIDHIDGNRSNNKIDNLRDVTNQHNQWNRVNAKGYVWSKQHKKFMARVRLNGKNIHIGLFDTTEEAHNAYLEAKKIYHIIPQ